MSFPVYLMNFVLRPPSLMAIVSSAIMTVPALKYLRYENLLPKNETYFAIATLIVFLVCLAASILAINLIFSICKGIYLKSNAVIIDKKIGKLLERERIFLVYCLAFDKRHVTVKISDEILQSLCSKGLLFHKECRASSTRLVEIPNLTWNYLRNNQTKLFPEIHCADIVVEARRVHDANITFFHS